MHRSRRIRRGLHRGGGCWCSCASLMLVLLFFVFSTFFVREERAVSGMRGKRPRPAAEFSTTASRISLFGSGKPTRDDVISSKDVNNATRSLRSTLESLSLLHVHFTGRKRAWTLKDLIEKVGYSNDNSSDITSTICPPLSNNLSIPMDEAFQIGMLREFVGGMYHPMYCKEWRRRTHSGSEHERGEADNVREEDVELACDTGIQKRLVDAIQHPPKYAYVIMVSTHRYLDGAMVLAESIREYSPLSRSHGADIVLIINEHIKSEMFPLLQVLFDRVQIFSGLQKWAPKSAFKATFDKLYLYMLEDYKEGILFLDADSLITANPDYLLQMHERIATVVNSNDTSYWTPARRAVLSYPLTEHEWQRLMHAKKMPLLFAVGYNKYFQTSLLTFRPSMKIFLKLYLEFRFGSYGYNSLQGRDGVLFRNCFATIGEWKRRPHEVYHFNGNPKPWFNQERLDHMLQPMKVLMRTEQLLSWQDYIYYYEWWTRYERLHIKYFRLIEMETRTRFGSTQIAELRKLKTQYGDSLTRISPDVHITKYGGAMLLRRPTSEVPLPLGMHSVEEAAQASPSSFMWLMRFNRAVEYLHPTRAHMAQLRRATVPLASTKELSLLLSVFNTSSVKTWEHKDIVYAFAASSQDEADNTNDASWSSCETQCARLRLRCNASLLIDTRIADCQYSQPPLFMANGIIRCKHCKPYFKSGAPFVVFQKHEKNGLWVQEASVCFFSAWTRFAAPLCNATRPTLHQYNLKKGEFLAPVCPCQ
ncbi:putative glycogenin glucosyltransferase [Trypanosoma rangeli]|uniref:Putative glycogenin glucosyltransferase n=1 Tax=Trypanosoma rangeli TaxID=5698 RepID=A0A3S5IS93_TRYRA|nr:putative glycogenin glucosyltransferase [Trypanosoma rangeli]RNF10335.1 putative glycogenin glucosyltransferase [Trypanosoma rangeli]|eukprot:RNF10335.1 putative glycogenin glucosyltransferase [Trypanosoma rangeli]